MPFDIEGARSAGYSDAEIAGFLADKEGFDLDAATKAGYQPADVIGFLSSRQKAAAVPDAGAGRGLASDPRRLDREQGPIATSGAAGMMPSPAASMPSASSSGVATTPQKLDAQGRPVPEPGIGDELGQLRDEAFSGIDQAISAGRNVDAASQARSMQALSARIQSLESAGEGDSVRARQLRGELSALQKRFPGVVQAAAESSATAQRGAQMVTRPAVRKVSEAKTFGEAWEAFKEAPYDVIAGVTAQSLPHTLPALITAAVAGPAAGAVAMGASSAVVEFGSSVSEFARENGVDPTQGEQLQAFLSDPQKLGQALEYAGKRAGIIATLDAASGGVASKTIGPVAARPLVRQAVNVPAQMGVQAAMGGAGEAGAQLATKGTIDQPGEVLMEAAGELGGAPMEVASFSSEALRRTPEQSADRVMSAQTVDEAINTAAQEAQAPVPPAATPRQPTPAAAAESSPPPAARPEAAAAVDNIARILGQESADAGQPMGTAAEPAGSGGRGSPDGVGGIADRGLQPGEPGPVGSAASSQPVASSAEAVPARDGTGRAAALEPAATWVGRRGDGYATQEDAAAALPSRQRVRPDLDWRVEPTPEGRFRLAGYAASSSAGVESDSTSAAFRFTVNPSGTLTVQGDPRAIRERLSAAGVTQVAAGTSGVMVGRSQAQQAVQALSRPTGSVAQEAVPAQNAAYAPQPDSSPDPEPVPVAQQPAGAAASGAGAATVPDGAGVPAGMGAAVAPGRPVVGADGASGVPAARPGPQPGPDVPGLEAGEPGRGGAGAGGMAVGAAVPGAGQVPDGAGAGPAARSLAAQPPQQAPSPEGVSVSAPQFQATLNPSGTLTIKGDPEAIKATLRAGGITQGVVRRDGSVLVGKSQAQAAQKLAAFQTNSEPSNVVTAAPAPDAQPAAADDAQAQGGPASAQPAVDEQAVEAAAPDVGAPAQRDAFDAPMRSSPPPLDHGELNIPGRTKNINRDLDRYKAEQERAQKADAKQAATKRKEDKAQAKELFAEMWPAMLEKMGPRFGEKQLRETLDSMVKWQPAKFIAMAEKFRKEQGGKDAFDTVMRHRAFHGTPHDFDRFTTEKIGTGEGAQAYGWGLYFAENQGVAESYRKTLSSRHAEYEVSDGRVLKSEGDIGVMLESIATGQQTAEDWARLTEAEKREPDLVRAAEVAKTLIGKTLKIRPAQGRLLEVHIPDEVVDRMLLWDKPLSEQPEAVRAAIKKMFAGDALDADAKRLWREHGGDFATGKKLYELLATSDSLRDDGSGREVSLALDAAGIPGIRYLDGGSRPKDMMDDRARALVEKHDGDIDAALAEYMRSVFNTPAQKKSIEATIRKDMERWQRPTYNLVVFNDKNVEITHKDGSPVTKKERDDFLGDALRRGDFQVGSEVESDSTRLKVVRQFVDSLAAGWKDKPTIHVVESVADMPGDHPADTRGMYRRGEVWIVASAPEHNTRAGVAKTLAHEAVAHYGLRKMLGREAWTRLMRDIQLGIRAKNKALLALQAEVREAYVDEEGDFALSAAEEADEIAARAVEQALDAEGNFRPGFAFLKAAFARVAQFLRGILGERVTFTNTELQGMLVLSMRNMERGERTAGGGDVVLAGAPAARSRVSALQELSEADELFAIPKSDKDTVEGIVADIAPSDFTVSKPSTVGLETTFTIRDQNGNTAKITARKVNPYGPSAYGLLDGENGPEAVYERPGVNPYDVGPEVEDVFINISEAKPGTRFGEVAYSVAANFAHNTGRIFIGDPAGLSDVAMRRRLEQMISSALKFGTTAHLAPHPSQAQGDRRLGIPALRWVYGDHEGNVERMIQVSQEALAKSFPKANLIAYDPADGTFYRTDTGARFTERAELARVVGRSIAGRFAADGGTGRAGQAGWRTLARAALLRHLQASAAGEPGQRGRLLDRLRAQRSLLGRDPATGGAFEAQDRIFYARGAVAGQHAAPAGAQPAPSPTSPWRDPTGRLQFAPGAWLYEKLGTAAGPLLTKLQLKAASPKLRRALREMKLQVQQAQDTAAAVASEAMKLSEDERSMVSDLIEQELAAGTVPPAHAVRLAAMINSSMGAQTDELVRLGMLSEDSAEMWRGKYLPRYYRNKLGKQVGDAWADAVGKLFGRTRTMAGIKGKHLRGRGLYENVPASEVAQWEDMGWEVRDPDHPAASGAEISQQILAGTLAPEDQVQVWRDFTREERENMGEIRDAGFRFVMGYMQTQRDIALGRLFEQLAGDAEMSSKKETPQFTIRVPDGTVTGTGAKRYGKLAGRWVSKDTFSHLTQIEESQSEAWKMYRKALALWKEGRVALNPVSHVNNMVSNLTMAHFAGVSYLRADKYIAAARDFAMKAEGVKEAKEAGLFLGTMSDAELMNVLPEDLKALVKQQDSAATKIGRSAFNVMTFFLRRPMGWAYQAEDTFFRYLIYKDARSRGMEPGDAVDYAQRYIFAYDDLPKGARMIRDFGIPFFAYTYKAVPALLHTALTHPVRMAAPAAVLWGINAAAYAIATADDDDDWLETLERYIRDADFRAEVREKEKLEREHLPPWMKGSTSLGTPKAIRLGMDEVTKLPLFIDTSRIVPGGDLFDVNPNGGGIPWIQPITPSNPLLTTYMAMFGNKDAWFGKEIVDTNDTRGEAAAKRAEWLWRQASPAVAFGNYHFQRGMQALAQAMGEEVRWLPEKVAPDAVVTGIGRDGLPVQPKYAAMQTFGIKVRPIDLETSEEIGESLKSKMVRDIDTEMRRLLRLNQKGAISDSVYDRELERAQVKKDRLNEGLTVDGDEKD